MTQHRLGVALRSVGTQLVVRFSATHALPVPQAVREVEQLLGPGGAGVRGVARDVRGAEDLGADLVGFLAWLQAYARGLGLPVRLRGASATLRARIDAADPTGPANPALPAPPAGGP